MSRFVSIHPFQEQHTPELIVAGQSIPQGSCVDLHLDYSENLTGLKIGVPVRIMRAKKPGPRVFMTGLVHGDELNGMGIIHELLFENPPKLIRGTIIALPVVNVFGLESYSRYLPDRRDLNRSFPGTPAGSMTGRLAHLVFREVVRKCDYGLDFHTAAVRRTNYPNLRADLDDPRVEELSDAFGCEITVHNKGAPGSLRREASRRGIPTIVLEAGEVWKMEPRVIELGVRGAMNVLRHLGMVSGRKIKPAYHTSVRRSRWVRAERGSVLNFHVQAGDAVKKGDVVATSIGALGQLKDRIESPEDGIVLGMTTMPVVKPGDPVVHLALPSEPIETIMHKIRKRSDQSLHTRIQKDLASNIRVTEVPTLEPE